MDYWKLNGYSLIDGTFQTAQSVDFPGENICLECILYFLTKESLRKCYGVKLNRIIVSHIYGNSHEKSILIHPLTFRTSGAHFLLGFRVSLMTISFILP